MRLDLAIYRERAEACLTALDLEYYRHYAGLTNQYEIEAVYAAYGDLFTADAVRELRGLAATAGGDEARARRHLLEFAVDGFIGRATAAQSAELARREAALELDLDEGSLPFRQAVLAQANEPDPARRAQIEQARLDLLDRELNPLYRTIVERSQALATGLGWTSYREMYAQLKGIDLGDLGRQAQGFLGATDDLFEEVVGPPLEAELGHGLERFRRCDLPYFLRAPRHDRRFPASTLISSFERTLSGLGVELAAQPNVILDTEPRPTKSSRAFCATVRVPDEIYLVVPRVGGRDDYSVLFHEGGHAEHYAHVQRELPFEYRFLGDSSVTEGFAFLLDHLTQSEAWLRRILGVPDVEPITSHARAARLIFCRRYAAKLVYELELHGGEVAPEALPARYAELLGRAMQCEWPTATHLADIDPGFYVACYLRAWLAEASLRRLLSERFGEAWFERREAGDLLRSLWRGGQRLSVEELLTEAGAAPLDFGLLLADVGA